MIGTAKIKWQYRSDGMRNTRNIFNDSVFSASHPIIGSSRVALEEALGHSLAWELLLLPNTNVCCNWELVMKNLKDLLHT
jgi:hypothetical protein